MKIFRLIPICLLILIISISLTYPNWPTDIQTDLSIAVHPDSFETACVAIPFNTDEVLVAFRIGYTGPVYQILNKYGEKRFEPALQFAPQLSYAPSEELHLIADEMGGAIACWSRGGVLADEIVAQRIDSQGNLIWNDSGIVIFPNYEIDVDIIADGDGGFFLAVGLEGDLWAQHVSYDGSLLWGDSGVVIIGEEGGQSWPELVSDGVGGFYCAWLDFRPGTPFYGAIYVQHIDENGIPIWNEDLLITGPPWDWKLISDGEGGVILQFVHGGLTDYYRINPAGNILWTIPNLFEYDVIPQIVHGEPGYFYSGYKSLSPLWAQRLDLQGNTYLPNFGSTVGSIMIVNHIYTQNSNQDYFYAYPHFYTIIDYRLNNFFPKFYAYQKIDSLGNRMFDIGGIVMSSINDYDFKYTNAIYDGYGGAVLVYEHFWGGGLHDIWAKHVDKYGNLGGPLRLDVSLTPNTTPIQIPAGGGEFSFDLSISDTLSVGTHFDAWIEAVLPDGSTLDLIIRENIPIDSGATILKLNVTQFVPGHAPAGDYTYTLFTGWYEFDDPWGGTDSFVFEKLPGESSVPYVRANGRSPLQNHHTAQDFRDAGVLHATPSGKEGEDVAGRKHGFAPAGWELTGFFEEKDNTCRSDLLNPINSLGNNGGSDQIRPTFAVSPNPFNASTTITFELATAGNVSIDIFDITGRNVRASRATPGNAMPENQYLPAGSHSVVFDGEGLSSGIYFVRLKDGKISRTQKILLIK